MGGKATQNRQNGWGLAARHGLDAFCRKCSPRPVRELSAVFKADLIEAPLGLLALLSALEPRPERSHRCFCCATAEMDAGQFALLVVLAEGDRQTSFRQPVLPVRTLWHERSDGLGEPNHRTFVTHADGEDQILSFAALNANVAFTDEQTTGPRETLATDLRGLNHDRPSRSRHVFMVTHCFSQRQGIAGAPSSCASDQLHTADNASRRTRTALRVSVEGDASSCT